MPVVVAGDDTGRRRVAAWVSERSHRGPVHELRVPDTVDKQTVVAQARQLMREHSQWHADGKARRITRAASKSLPDVVAGAAASRAMLRAGLVKTLLVVPDLVRTTGWHRASCDETVGALVAPANWSQRGDRMRASCQPLTELVRMASQRGVEVLVSTTDELRELGGVACLLAEPAERHLMPAPALVRPMGMAA